jgi:hypothetical protein
VKPLNTFKDYLFFMVGLMTLAHKPLAFAQARPVSAGLDHVLRQLLALVLVGCASPIVPAAAAEPGPQWITPHDGEMVPYPNDLVFEVAPVNGAVGYLYGFNENGQWVWENWSHERHLDGTRYILARGSPGHLALSFGAMGQVSWPLQIWVRGYILEGGQYHWTEASIINITLVGFGCIYGPGGSCLEQSVYPIPENQWPSPDEVREQLLHIGMGALCAAEYLAAYAQYGPVGLLVLLPNIITSEPCMDLTQETIRQVNALLACIPRYGWEVCLGLP